MNKRLLTIANFIGKQKCMYDIGCDHAFLSIYVVKNHLVDYVINFDINKQPLENGLINVKKEGLENQIEFVLNDGLLNYEPQIYPDVVCISGMGANLMMKIVTHTTFNVKRWIMQPNNNAYKLRAFMNDLGYMIKNETVVYENKIYYDVILFEKDSQNFYKYTDKECFFGPLNLIHENSLLELRYLSDLNKYKQYDFEKLNQALKDRIALIEEWLNRKHD